MEVAALGRPFSLGMLYDCRKDLLIPGLTLWDYSDLQKDIGEKSQSYSDFEIVVSESIEDKSLALNVSPSLKASFLGGLVEVGGSASYLNESKASKNKARVTLNYKATTKVQELSMNQLGRENVKHPYVFDQGIATHVVTAILFGAQAFFVFDQMVSDQENHQDIQGNLNLIIQKIPCASFEGEGVLKLEGEDKAMVESFCCRFYGDFSIQNPPTTFEGAVEVYQNLPKLLGPNGENAVPMKAWLLPLACLDSKAAKLVCQISIGLVQEAQNVLEDFRELEMRCNDVLETTTAQQFPEIGKNLKSFKEMASWFKLKFQRTLAMKLPLIREGKREEETELAEILEKRHSSPFNSKDMTVWMDSKEREIYTLKTFTSMMTSTKTIPSENELYKESLTAKHVLCFVFTFLGTTEPYLSALSDYLKEMTELDNPQHPYSYDVEKNQWYTSKELVNNMVIKAKLFSDFAEANKENENIKFLMVGLTNEKHRGSSIYFYKDGFSVSENYEPASKPETVTVEDLNHNSVTLKISPPRYGAQNVTSYSVEYRVRGEDGWKLETHPKSEEITVRDLRPNTEYEFRCRAVILPGVGPASEVSIRTKIPPHMQTLLTELLRKSKKLKSGSPSVYQLPLTEEDMNIDGCRRFNFGEGSTGQSRTIMLCGGTGSGKSAVINGMINYIVGVEFKDSFRFKLVDEAQSQNTEVTMYKINHQDGFKVPFSLTIIDMPGFGDTAGIERDKMITEHLRHLISAENGVGEVNAVGFVVQAALTQLTATQKYMFDSVISVFSEDVEDNIRILVTDINSLHPPVLKAISGSGVLCPKTDDGLPVHFKFNDSALFAHKKLSEEYCIRDDNEKEEDFGKMFWNIGIKSMKSFFCALNVMEPKTLIMTKEILRERRQLEREVESLQEQIKEELVKAGEMRDTLKYMCHHLRKISTNTNTEFEVSVMKAHKDYTDGPEYFLNCQRCYVTCHYPGPPSSPSDTEGESEPQSDTGGRHEVEPRGFCTKCPGKCHIDLHFLQKNKWEYHEVMEKQTVNDLKKKFPRASEGLSCGCGLLFIPTGLMRDLVAEIDQVEGEVEKLMKTSAECLNKLTGTSLKSDPISTEDYINMVTEGERLEGKPGWETRVQSLKKDRTFDIKSKIVPFLLRDHVH
ncbi:uncharacterized protein KZ484_021924 [Pholidichthys leucotaenia]